MLVTTRRTFLRSLAPALLAVPAALDWRHACAAAFGLPLGLQLYSVREPLAKDFTGTLLKVAAAGYTEVEAAGYFAHSAAEVRRAMQTAGLRCVSAHYSYDDLAKDFETILDFNHQVGVRALICSFPGLKNPSRLKDLSFANRVRSFNLEDFRWNAERFNQMGEKVKQAGMRFGYHNHTMEFAPQEGVVPLDEMMRLTDPALVTFELDCGWVVVGGATPIDYLTRYPTRISMLHVKDFKKGTGHVSVVDPPPAAELGRGTLDYRAILAAVKPGSLRHVFVEQEGYDLPMFEALRLDAEYMAHLGG
jgi:sugar phosphate isomerase/epimerase